MMSEQSKRVKINKKYQPLFSLSGQWRYAIVSGGRGSGKSYGLTVSETIHKNSRVKAENTLYLRQTLTSAHLSIIPEFWEKVELLGLSGNFIKTKQEIVHIINGSQIFFRGIQSSSKSNEANLKSVHNVTTVIIDEAQEVGEKEFDRINLSVRSAETRNRIILSLNPTEDENHWIHRRFFTEKNIPDDFNGIVDNVLYVHTTYLDNLDNLSEDFIAEAEQCKQRNFEKYKNQFLGFWGGQRANALWKHDTMLAPYRVHYVNPDELDRIVIGVDPAVTSTSQSDETGIVAVGMKRGRNGADSHFYVLDDASLRGTPQQWAQAAVELYWYHSADRIIGEVNNGGDLIESVLRGVDRDVSFKAVRATRGKLVRAEPIAALYEQGRVHHVGYLPQLEAQMCNYTGIDGEKSPDRLDALVWAITELASGKTQASSGNLNRLF